MLLPRTKRPNTTNSGGTRSQHDGGAAYQREVRRHLSMNFEFTTSATIVFGRGASKRIEKKQRVFVVTGSHPERAERLGIEGTYFSVSGEPTIDLIREGTQKARQCDSVIGIGGGSVSEAGKAISAMMTNPGDPLDYLEVIGRGQPLKNPAAPYTAIPTTAGTGSEVTRNAV